MINTIDKRFIVINKSEKIPVQISWDEYDIYLETNDGRYQGKIPISNLNEMPYALEETLRQLLSRPNSQLDICEVLAFLASLKQKVIDLAEDRLTENLIQDQVYRVRNERAIDLDAIEKVIGLIQYFQQREYEAKQEGE